MARTGPAPAARRAAGLPLRRSACFVPLLALLTACGTPGAPFGGRDGPSRFLGLGLLADNQAPHIVGHRGGASGKAPENTMAAFKLGPANGAGTLECDVQCSRDDALVIIHDRTVDRTTDGKGAVRDLTLAQLEQLDAGQGERIPTLAELLAWTAAQPGLGMNVEIKASPKVCPGIADKVVAAVNQAGMAQRVMIISFHRGAVDRVEKLQPDLRSGLLFLLRVNPVKTARAVHADTLWAARQRTTTHMVKAAHEAHLPLYSWTLNSVKGLLEARRVGADAVVTDFPDVARDTFADRPATAPPPGTQNPQLADPEDREDPDDLTADER